MKILLLIKHFDFGGAENPVCDLANELVCSGHKVWLLSGKGRQNNRLQPGVVNDSVTFSELNMLPILFEIAKLIRQEQIEVIHAHQRFTIFLATLAGLLTKTPVIATVHGSIYHDLRSGFVRKKITGLIVCNENVYNIREQIPVLSRKLHLIPNGFVIPPSECLKTNEDHHFNFYYISRLDNRHACLIINIITKVWPQLIEKHPSSTFHIVGDGQGLKKIKKVLALPCHNKWSRSVVCDEYSDNVALHYQKADLVMGVGRVACESLIYGVPTLSIKHNHLGPIITRDNFEEICFSNFVAIKAPPIQPERLLNILEDFIFRFVYYKKEAGHLQKIATQRFNIQDIVLKTVEVYRNAIIEKTVEE